MSLPRSLVGKANMDHLSVCSSSSLLRLLPSAILKSSPVLFCGREELLLLRFVCFLFLLVGLFLIHLSNIWICVMVVFVRPAKKFHVGHYVQTIRPNLFIPTMLLDTFDLTFYTTVIDLDFLGVTRSSLILSIP